MTRSAPWSAVIVIVAVVVVAGVAGCPPPSPEGAPDVLPTGTTPNAVAVVRCADGPRLLVASSASSRLDVLDPHGVAPARSVFLGVGASPWDVAVVRHADAVGEDEASDDVARAVVTLVGSHAVALVQPCGAPALLDTFVDDTPIALPEPIALRVADDVDGDGATETTAVAMRPRSPQAAGGLADTSVVVAFANILDVSTGADAPMLAGPGLLVRLRLDDDDTRLAPVDRVLLPGCENPGGLAAAVVGQQGQGQAVAVACAGRFMLADGGHGKASDGAVVVVTVDADDGALVPGTPRVAAMTPGPIVVHDDALVVGDLLDGTLRRLDPVSLDVVDERAGAGGVDSAFSLVVTADDGLVAGWFDGRLAFDPFGAAVDHAAPAGPPRGLIDLVDDGERLWGLLTLSAELVALPREAP